MKTIKRLNSLRIFLWTMFGTLSTACMVLIVINKVDRNHKAYFFLFALISMWIICFLNSVLKKRERRLLAKSVLKIVSSILKQGGVRKYSLNCEMIETKKYVSLDISIENTIPEELYLKCQETVLTYLEPYGEMKRKIVEVNIRQYQSLVIGDFEG